MTATNHARVFRGNSELTGSVGRGLVGGQWSEETSQFLVVLVSERAQ